MPVPVANMGSPSPTFAQHRGLFNARYIHAQIGSPNGAIPFDIGTFDVLRVDVGAACRSGA